MWKRFLDFLFDGFCRAQNTFRSSLEVDYGCQTVDDAWRQHEYFAWSCMKSCKVVELFLNLAPVLTTIAYIAGSPTQSFSFIM